MIVRVCEAKGEVVIKVGGKQRNATPACSPIPPGRTFSDDELLDPEVTQAINRWAAGESFNTAATTARKNDGARPDRSARQVVSVDTVDRALAPFCGEKRELAIYPDKVTLCGIVVWSDKGVPDMREVLLLLRHREGGGYVHLQGPVLMEKLGRDPSNPIGRPIKDFCDKATVLLAEHRGLACGRYDVIDSRGGYHFTDWIVVEVVGDEAHEAHGNGPHEPHPSAWTARLAGLAPEQAERLLKLCHALTARSLSKEEIRRLSGVSRAQNTRDLKALDDRRLLAKTGPQRGRMYRLPASAMSLMSLKPAEPDSRR